MTTPTNSAEALAEPAEAIADAVSEGPGRPASAPSHADDLPPVGRWTVTVYALTMFGFQLTLLMPSLFSLAYKVQVVDPSGKDTSLGFVLGVGMVFGLVTGPVAGVLSDGTRLRWGRRRPFIGAGLVLSAIGALLIAAAPGVAGMVLGYAVAQIAVSAVSAAVNPFLAEQVPAAQRGKVGALGGVGSAMAGVGASLLGSFLTGSAYLLFLTPVAVFGVVALAYLLTVPDRPAPADARIGSVLEVFKGLWFNPVRHSDFALVWVGKFCLQFGFTFFSTYQLYFLLDRLGFTPEQAGRQLAVVGGFSLLAMVSFAIAGGTLSDRLGRRKPFIFLASGLIAGGLVVLASAGSFVVFAMGGVLLSAGTGAFNSVDLALATDVLPEKDKAGKYMGIYYLSSGVAGAVAPLLAPAILRLSGEGSSYSVLFLTGAVLSLGAAVTAWRIRSVR